MKKLYHGSIYSFDSVDIHMGRGYKDFGKGFYATAIPSHAERIAIRNKHIEERRQAAIHKRNPEIKLYPVMAYRYNLLYTVRDGNFQPTQVERISPIRVN